MKKKFVVALVAAMSLTVAGTGTVFAMDKVSTIASEKEHVHGDNCEWVVDKEAWTEEVVHPAETKQEWVVDKPAWTEEVVRMANFCNTCGFEIHSMDEWIAHSEASNGQCMGYHSEQVTEKIEHPEEGHYETVVVKPSWTETVEHPEEGHWVCNGEPQEPEQKPEQPENPEQKPEQPENPDQKPEQPENPEQKPEQPENPDQKPEQPENPDQKPEQPENPDQKPEQPENPDQKPEQPENPDQKPEQPENPDVETPENPDTENPATPEQKPEANKENVQTQETETKKEGTSPKTGDTTSALPVAGAGLASFGVVLATILKKRK